MRPIKFRALDRSTGRWQVISILELANGESSSWCDVDMETVSEFTGLHDKNGKEIYEGDFLRFENLNYDPSEGDTPWLYEPVTWKLLAWGLGEYLLSDYDPKDIEVIGNIYENPELLIK